MQLEFPGWIQDFLAGGLNIEVISEARGLGAQPLRSYKVLHNIPPKLRLIQDLGHI